MKNRPLTVGNRVTYKVNGVQKTILITDNDDIEMLKDLEILDMQAYEEQIKPLKELLNKE